MRRDRSGALMPLAALTGAGECLKLKPIPARTIREAGPLGGNRMFARPFAVPIAIFGAFAAALLAPAVATAQVSDDVVKIGVLTDMNGPASTPTGQGSVTAAQMAVDDFGGKVLGKPVSVIVGDHQLKPDIGSSIARRWYDVEQVDLIVDVPVSAVGLAVQNIANEKKKLFITHSTGSADFHGKFCSPYAIQWVFDTRALAVGTAQGSRQARRRQLVLHHRRLRLRPFAGARRLRRHHRPMAARCSARCARPLPRPICRPSSCRRRPRRRRSSALPQARPTTPTRSRPRASSASSRAASRWRGCWC